MTSLGLVETTDIMLAVGSSQGDLVIFQIPKPVLTDSGVSFPGTVQNIQQFSIKNVHTRAISALCWARNGERLFSGDQSGSLVMSVVDFFMNSVQTSFLSREQTEILSLSYLHKSLLVSCLTGSFLLDLTSGESQSRTEVGTGLGGTLLQEGVGRRSLKCLLLSPGNAVSVSDLSGNTERIVEFQEGLTRQHLEIPLLNPLNIAREEETSSEKILVLSHEEQRVVVWSRVSLHLLCLRTGSVLASCSSLRNVLDLSLTSSGELFILETGR